MTQEEAKKLGLGLYRLYWKSGGSSLAAVCQLHDGSKCYAATNWTADHITKIMSNDWRKVNHVTLIEAN